MANCTNRFNATIVRPMRFGIVNAGFDSAPAYGKVTTMKLLLFVLVGSLVAGCGGRVARPPDTPVTLIPERGGWFCQPHPSGTGWQCVQDPDLAAKPRPDRPPAAPGSPADRRDGAGTPAPAATPELDPAADWESPPHASSP
jgi:hypothetical protein